MFGLQGTSINSLGLTQPIGPPSASLRQEKARTETAKDFEAMFLSMMLKDMRQTLEPDSLFANDSGDVLGGLFDQVMSKHLADVGGVGLAATILRQTQTESPTHAERIRRTG